MTNQATEFVLSRFRPFEKKELFRFQAGTIEIQKSCSNGIDFCKYIKIMRNHRMVFDLLAVLDSLNMTNVQIVILGHIR